MPDALDHDKVCMHSDHRGWTSDASCTYDVHGGMMLAFLVQRVVIYPAYINSKVTVAGGRRVPKSEGKLTCIVVLPAAHFGMKFASGKRHCSLHAQAVRTPTSSRLPTAATLGSS